MSALSDPYKVLQVDPEAEREVIRAAYRALALKYHPDVSTGPHDRMAALNHAWGILRNGNARAAYDQARADAQRTPEAPEPEVSYEVRAPMSATPPGQPSGSVLDFGRYAGWSLGQIATGDPEYLEWLARTPIGRSFHAEIRDLLATRAAAAAAPRRQRQRQRQRQRRQLRASPAGR